MNKKNLLIISGVTLILLMSITFANAETEMNFGEVTSEINAGLSPLGQVTSEIEAGLNIITPENNVCDEIIKRCGC